LTKLLSNIKWLLFLVASFFETHCGEMLCLLARSREKVELCHHGTSRIDRQLNPDVLLKYSEVPLSNATSEWTGEYVVLCSADQY